MMAGWIRLALAVTLVSRMAAAGSGTDPGSATTTAAPKPARSSVVRCAVDIGSGTTRVRVARVSTANQTIESVVFEGEEKVGYKKAIGPDGQLPKTVVDEGAKAINGLKEKALEKLAPEERKLSCRGVASQAFREATNGSEALLDLSGRTGCVLSIVTQNEEAELGYFGAFARASKVLKKAPVPADTVVWDIGGGSQQIVARDGETKTLVVTKSTMASEPMKRFILDAQVASKRKPSDAQSPNPLSAEDAKSAVAHSRDALKTVAQKALLDKLKANRTVVLGIGGVWSKSIAGQLGVDEGAVITREAVRKLLDSAVAKQLDDKAIGGKYADTQVSNLSLALGAMEAVGVGRVIPLDVNLTEGILVNPAYW